MIEELRKIERTIDLLRRQRDKQKEFYNIEKTSCSLHALNHDERLLAHWIGRRDEMINDLNLVS